jgi:hypothetical protein
MATAAFVAWAKRNAGKGALIGAGALGGYLYDQHQKGTID